MVSKRNTSKILCSILRVPCIDKREYIWYSEKQLVLMAVRTHLYPYRTQKLSSPASKILGWRRPGKIERCQHKRKRTGETVRFVYSSLAQSVEHAAVNRRVVCSSQTGGAKREGSVDDSPCCFPFCFLYLLSQSTLCFGRRIAAVCTTLAWCAAEVVCRHCAQHSEASLLEEPKKKELGQKPGSFFFFFSVSF